MIFINDNKKIQSYILINWIGERIVMLLGFIFRFYKIKFGYLETLKFL